MPTTTYIVDDITWNFTVNTTDNYALLGTDSNVATANSTTLQGNLSGIVKIPSVVLYDGINYEVKTIGRFAFYNCTKLTRVILPESITNIKIYAFGNTDELQLINIPKLFPTADFAIHSKAFEITENETIKRLNVILENDQQLAVGDPAVVTSFNSPKPDVDFFGRTVNTVLSPYTTDPDTGVTTTTLTGTNKLTHAMIKVFDDHYTTTTVLNINGYSQIDQFLLTYDGLINAGIFLFRDIKFLTISLTPVQGTQCSIGVSSFNNSANLESLTIQDGVTAIFADAFGDCPKLASIIIPETVDTIGVKAFGFTSTTADVSTTVIIKNGQIISGTTFQSPATDISFFGRTVTTKLLGGIDPPNVIFPTTSPTTDGTVIVTPESGATSWRYSLDNGTTWTAGANTSFTIPYGTYAIDYIQVDNSDSTSTSATVNNIIEIIVGAEFDTTAANAKKNDLVTLINGLSEVKNVKEIYKLWYNTTQIYGGTDVWVYYVYEATDDSIIYNTRKFQFNSHTQLWTVSSPYVDADNDVSVSSHGLTSTDLTDDYVVLYTGLDPFQMDVTTDSLASLKTVYDIYTSNINSVHNIWYDVRNIFSLNFDNTTREVDAWIYVFTGNYVGNVINNDNMIFETRKVKYAVQDTTYTWSIPTDETLSYESTTTITETNAAGETTETTETVTVTPTVVDTLYGRIPDSSNFVLSYFYFDVYLITNSASIRALKDTYRAYFENSRVIQTVDELWYDKSTITPHDANYDVAYNDTNLTVYNINMVLYCVKNNITSVTNVTTPWTKLEIKYSKNTRNWSILPSSDTYSNASNSGFTDDNIIPTDFTQIISNISYDTSTKISNLQIIYNNTHTPDIDTIYTVWRPTTYSNPTPMFLFFSTSDSESNYTTANYDRVTGNWSADTKNIDYDESLVNIIIYVDFQVTAIEGILDSIKTAYNAELADKSIVNVHKLWYDSSTINTSVTLKIHHSYNIGQDKTKLYFGIVDINYNLLVNTDNISVVADTFQQQTYNYNNDGTALSSDYVIVTSYNVVVSFDIDTSFPIMIDNSTIKSQFDASYNEINNTSLTINIHNVWVTNVTDIGTGTGIMSYKTPIQNMYVYYSFLDSNDNIIYYKSRTLDYNLQLNVWVLTSSDTITAGTIRTSGITADLSGFTKIFESLPDIPIFSTDTASTDNSINSLKTVIATYYSMVANDLEIYNIWCRVTDVELQLVKCVVFLSISTVNNSNTTETYKTLVINYNNDTNTWHISDPFVSRDSSETDNKFSTITAGEDAADYFMFYTTIVEAIHNTLVEKDKITYNGKLIQNQKLPRVGTVVMWGGGTAPNGAFLCDGSPYTITDYPLLYSVIGSRYGDVYFPYPLSFNKDITKFKVPDFRNGYLFGSSSLTNCTYDNAGNWQIQKFNHYHMVDVTACKYISSQSSTIERPDSSRGDAYYYNTETNMGLTAGNNTTDTKDSYRPNYTLCNFIIYHD